MEIKKVDQDKKTAEIAYSWTGGTSKKSGKAKATATFIPPAKLKWFTKIGIDYRFELNEGDLWGTRNIKGKETQKIVLKKVKE